MTEETIEQFLLAAPEDRLRMAADDGNADALKQYFGQQAYEEYRTLAARLDEQHLGVKSAKNLVFIPGVMGSLLKSETKGGIWWIDVRTRNHIDDLRLSPDGLEDADPNNQIAPCSTDPTYEPFLTAVLERDDFGHVVFPYDWRKPLILSADSLKDRVLNLYDTNGGLPVNLVAHSMGGLMLRATLMKHGDELWPKVGRIVFIGTPHYGSPAIGGYVKNHLWGFELLALMGKYLTPDTFRSLWGVLSLLPAPRGVYPGTRQGEPEQWHSGDPSDPYQHPCANFDLYDADSWRLGLTGEKRDRFQTILTAAADFHKQMYDAHEKLNQDFRDRMLVIAGVGYKTLFRLAYEPRFFGVWERMEKVTSRIENDPHREGDGRVPLASAALENVQIRYSKGVHGGLPNIPQIYSEAFRWLNDEPLQLPDSVSGALSQHLAAEDERSAAPHLDGTSRQIPFSDDPGLWNTLPPEQDHLEALDSKLDQGQVPEFINVRLL
ncbi:MAG TPA: hypothetical protein VE262_16110 [Blastocatellia bacterium]|nr:hypothetical protein [Blastocatellia bacterium]